MIRPLSLLVFALVLASAGLVAGGPRATAASNPPVIVFFGDSLTAGLHASSPDATYRQIVANRLAKTGDQGPAYAFIEDPVGLLDDAQSKVPLVLAARPTLVFLELGHHEVWAGDGAVDLFEERYNDILDHLLRSGADVIPSTLAWLNFAADSPEYRAALRINGIIRRVAAQRGLVVADLWSPTDLRSDLLSTPGDFSFVEPYAGDDLHPNDAGHRAMADAFWRAYLDLRRQGRPPVLGPRW